MSTTQLQLKIGERYWRRDGMLSGAIGPNLSENYPYRDLATFSTYSAQGKAYRLSETWYDLIRLADPSEYNRKPDNPEGDTLPDPSMLIISPEQYSDMKAIIELQMAKIERLQAAIDRKNKVFSEVMDMVRYELAKEIE